MDTSIREIRKYEKKIRPEQTGVPVMVRLQPKALAALDEWRQRQPDKPTRAEALRRRAALDNGA